MLEQQVSCLSGHVEFVRVTLYGAMDVSTKGVCLGDPLANFFLHPLTWMAPQKMFWSCIFSCQRQLRKTMKIFKNPDQYKQQHSKRYKQSATCHIFLSSKSPQNDPQKKIRDHKGDIPDRKKPRGGWEVGRKDTTKIIWVKEWRPTRRFEF